MYTTAIRIARYFHEGQLDKAGEPYIKHPIRVAGYLKTVDTKTVALLHDTVEDTGATLPYLREFFPERIVEAVDAMKHRKNESISDYYERVRDNQLAMQVKLCDVLDNLMPDHLNKLDEETRTRLKAKYLNALQYLI